MTASQTARAAARVQAGRRLVEEDHLRAGDEAHRQVEPAPHAAAVGRDAAVGGVGEVEPLEQLVGAPLAVRRRRSRAIIRRFSAPVSRPSTAASCAVRLIAARTALRLA